MESKGVCAMNFQERQASLKRLIIEKQLSHYIILGMVILNVLTLFLLSQKEEKWILIPQYDVSHRVVVTSDGYTDQYFKDLAHGALVHLLTVNPTIVQRQVQLFREFVRTGSAAEHYLKKHQKYVIDNSVSMAFYPKDYDVDQSQKTIRVKGELKYWFGGGKMPINKPITFILKYTIVGKQLVLIKDIREESAMPDNEGERI